MDSKKLTMAAEDGLANRFRIIINGTAIKTGESRFTGPMTLCQNSCNGYTNESCSRGGSTASGVGRKNGRIDTCLFELLFDPMTNSRASYRAMGFLATDKESVTMRVTTQLRSVLDISL